MSGPWYCWIGGKGNAKRPHATLEIAMAEAQRLRELREGGTVYVLQCVSILDPLPPPENAPSGRKILRVKKTLDSEPEKV